MPMYSFSSRRRTSTFSVTVSTMCRSQCSRFDRTVYHIEQHRRGEERLWWQVDRKNDLWPCWSSSTESWGTGWWPAGAVYASIACSRALVLYCCERPQALRRTRAGRRLPRSFGCLLGLW